ncbi:hypothetical protein GCM10007898_28950 [Dyella flagellata]|uniref:Uncharacterized protein n=1 Tax=Dyella flagellata TaxID=1867833 RepID=A0ABQ5XDE2_9GAMM|nr:hypothetical protein GCM10007898_28950 [Dyella flagellata]
MSPLKSFLVVAFISLTVLSARAQNGTAKVSNAVTGAAGSHTAQDVRFVMAVSAANKTIAKCSRYSKPNPQCLRHWRRAGRVADGRRRRFRIGKRRVFRCRQWRLGVWVWIFGCRSRRRWIWLGHFPVDWQRHVRPQTNQYGPQASRQQAIEC